MSKLEQQIEKLFVTERCFVIDCDYEKSFNKSRHEYCPKCGGMLNYFSYPSKEEILEGIKSLLYTNDLNKKVKEKYNCFAVCRIKNKSLVGDGTEHPIYGLFTYYPIFKNREQAEQYMSTIDTSDDKIFEIQKVEIEVKN